MENCPEDDIHSYKDLWNEKKLGILKDKTLSVFDESTVYVCLYFVLPGQTQLTRFCVP